MGCDVKAHSNQATTTHAKHTKSYQTSKTAQQDFQTFNQHCWCLIATKIHSSTFNTYAI